MDVILPERQDSNKFLEYASQISYDEFNAKMFVFFTNSSDVDVYQLMVDDRILQLIYGWEACQIHKRESITEELCYIVKVLAHHTLQVWFSQEWIGSSESLKRMVLYYLSKASSVFAQIDGLRQINWQYLLNFQNHPWRLQYLQRLFLSLSKNKYQIIEHSVSPATNEDVSFLMQERFHLIILRLIKLFDSGSWEAVKQLSLRVLTAWISINEKATKEALASERASITLVAHMYLLTVFVADENRGYVIDNMMYNIRFYANSMQKTPPEVEYTPARLIAQVCVLLGLGKDGFFERIVFKEFNLTMITPFAVMLKAYTSYVLGNQLLGMMALNEHDFMANIDQFNLLMRRYVDEREDSEHFLLNELQKLDSQRNSHALPQTVNLKLNYQQQICKGNRASNIGNYKNCDDDEKPMLEVDEELDRQIDPVFQNVPNSEEVLESVYRLLAQRNFRGWQFAKIVLLLKIIGQKLNTIEVWKYHPGLTTEFMLNLENKLSDRYADLAKLFSEYGFLEAEFWLTAFYLNPTRNNYNEVKRCSRIKKKRKEEEEQNCSKSVVKYEKADPVKYELLSSTIDVDEIVNITNHNAPIADYDPIYKALQSLRLPRSIIKDLLTVAFQPRNKRYSWALEWSSLYERCSALVKSEDLKRKFVALNMAEANDRLQYLKIDYDKYKNRPQLDYGSIEEGYENAAAGAEVSADEDDEMSQREAREKAESQGARKRSNPRKFWDEISEDDEEEDEDSDASEAFYSGSGRRTRAAAVIANAMITDERVMRSGRRTPPLPTNATEQADQKTQKCGESQVIPPPVLFEPFSETSTLQKRSLSELLKDQVIYSNKTSGFKTFADIWSCEKVELESLKNDNELMESKKLFSKFRSLQGLKKNPRTYLSDHMDEELQPVRCSSRQISDADSSDTGTSTMALHDSNDFEDDQSGVSKEVTPPPGASSDFSLATEVLQLEKKLMPIDEANIELEEIGRLQMNTDIPTTTSAEVATTRRLNDTDKSLEENDDIAKCKRFKMNFTENLNENAECNINERLINECLTRQLHVRLHKLTTQDIEKLRGVRVLIKRTNLVGYYKENSTESVRTLTPTGRRRRTQSEGSNKSPNHATLHLQKSSVKPFLHITSDTPVESTRGQNLMQSKQRTNRQLKVLASDSSSSTDHEESNRKSTIRRRRDSKIRPNPLNFVMSKKIKAGDHITADTVIELSSESLSSSSSTVAIRVNQFSKVAMELDPLYEEEIVPF